MKFDKFIGLVDTGASCTLVSRQLFQSIHGQILEEREQVINLVDNQKSVVKSYAGSFTVFGVVLDKLLVTENEPTTIDKRPMSAILGCDWLSRGRVLIKFNGPLVEVDIRCNKAVVEQVNVVSMKGEQIEEDSARDSEEVLMTIEKEDFILRKLRRTKEGPSKFRWEVEWK